MEESGCQTSHPAPGEFEILNQCVKRRIVMLPASYRESHLSMWSHVSMKKTQAQAAEIHELNPQGGDGGK